MTTTHEITDLPQPSWATDTLEGHIGNALQMQQFIADGIVPDGAQARLYMCLNDLGERLHKQGLTAVETMRGRADLIVMQVSGNISARVQRIEDYKQALERSA